MNTIKSIYRTLDALQQRMGVKLALTALALALCAGVFGPLILTSYSLDTQRQTLLAAIETANIDDGDPHAQSLRAAGTITIDDQTWQLHSLLERRDEIFDQDGYIAVPAYVVDDLLRREIPGWAPLWLLDQPRTTMLLAFVFTIWLLLIIWVQISVPFLLTILGTMIPVGILWYIGREQAMVAVAGIGLLTFTYVLLSRSMMTLYDRPNQVLAVAHTVIKEASRRRVSLGFIILLLVLLPLLPLWLDPEAPLRYRVQTFISRSMTLTFVIAACMTLLLSCATVAFEIRDRQIWHLVTKPLSRFNYLFGKWIGVVTVNMILLVVSGVSIFTFVQYLRMQPVAPGIDGQLDRVQVEHEVLTARTGTKPHYHSLTGDQVRQRLDQIIENDPDMREANLSFSDRQQMATQIVQQHYASQRQIPPRQARQYVFSGLEQAREYGIPLTLRYRFYIMESDSHATYEAEFEFNDDPSMRTLRTYVPGMAHVMLIGPDVVREDGTVRIAILNRFDPPPGYEQPGSITFDEKDFELLYKVGNFEGNFLRAVLILWVKLAFLSMLGIFCATYLSFPVACLLSFTVFVAGSMSPYLAEAIYFYEPFEFASIDQSDIGAVIQWSFQSVVTMIAQGLVFALEAFGAYRPNQSLVEGRLIAWQSVGGAFITIGVFWSGLALLFGYLVLRSRQLAIYSGRG